MKSFHFDLGNSTDGPIGFCARIQANSKEEAVETLKAALEHFGSEIDAKKATGLSGATDKDFKGARNVEYIEVYFNADAIKAEAIDEVNKS